MSEDEPIIESKSDERFRLMCTRYQVTTNGTKKDQQAREKCFNTRYSSREFSYANDKITFIAVYTLPV